MGTDLRKVEITQAPIVRRSLSSADWSKKEKRKEKNQPPEGKMMLCPRHMSAESRFHDQSHRGF
jgi:hypothetical protein